MTVGVSSVSHPSCCFFVFTFEKHEPGAHRSKHDIRTPQADTG